MEPSLLVYALVLTACSFGLIMCLADPRRPRSAPTVCGTGMRAALAGLTDVL